MIKALIFDLDNCLAAANEVGDSLYDRPFEAIRKANCGTLSEEQLQAAFSECWRLPLDYVAAKFGFSEAMLSAGWEIFTHTIVEKPMKGYGDLDVLPELGVELYLVTSGFRRLQESKVKAIGFEHLFAGIHIDAIDEVDRKGKQRIFESILETGGFKPEEVIVVGDNPDSEIEAGNRLGMRTVQILRPGVPRGDNATHYISALSELRPLLQTASSGGG